MEFLRSIYYSYIPYLQIRDIFEILVFVVLIYQILYSLKGTRAMVVLKGALFLYLLYAVCYVFKLEILVYLFQQVFTIIIFALIIVFQPELRKFFENIGVKNIAGNIRIRDLFKKKVSRKEYFSEKTVTELSNACFSMGEKYTGALIVIEREIPLNEFIDTGIAVNADITSQLLINIFEKNTPLHDGAVIQKGDKILSATCYLPLTQTPIDKNLGTRHRAAVGISEVTDCIVIVVSEETGGVSIVENGQIYRKLSKEEFADKLLSYRYKDVVFEEDISEKKTFKDYIKKGNYGLKILSLFLALSLWVLLINIVNPMTTKIFRGVPIEFVNTSVIEATGRTFELVSGNTVDVTITDKRSIVDTLKSDDIKIMADFTKLSYVNAIPLEVNVLKSENGTVTLSESSAIVELDSIVSREMTVTVEKYASVETNYYVPSVELDKETVVLTGGKKKLDTIDKIVAVFDIATETENYEGEADIVIYDKNGEILSNDLFTLSSSTIKATGVGYPVREVPITVIADRDMVDSYKITDISYKPTSVKIAGDPDYLDSFEKLIFVVNAAIDTETLTNNQYIKNVNILDQIPEGVLYADEIEEIEVTFSFEVLTTKTIAFLGSYIQVIGLDTEKYQAIIEDSDFAVNISGDGEIVERLNSENIYPFVDATGLLEGTYNLILQFYGLDDVILETNRSVKISILPL